MATSDYGTHVGEDGFGCHTPNFLYHRFGLAVPKARNCGDHEWYNAGNGMDGCYHCMVERIRLASSN
ncbi:MAG TPA: hypothetical protein VIP78_04250 [Candidatus Dormibacteraeota bacterium]